MGMLEPRLLRLAPIGVALVDRLFTPPDESAEPKEAPRCLSEGNEPAFLLFVLTPSAKELSRKFNALTPPSTATAASDELGEL